MGNSIKDVSVNDAAAVGADRAAKMAEERHAAFIKAMTAQTEENTFRDWMTTIMLLALAVPLVIAEWRWALGL